MNDRRSELAAEMAHDAQRLIEIGSKMLATAVTLGARVPEDGWKHADEPRIASFVQGLSPEVKAETLYQKRRVRESMFPPGLFGEPAWDILLDLFIATRRGERLSVLATCIGSQVPNTTALRYIDLLEENGLIVRERDGSDCRRYLLKLSALGLQKMDTFFDLSDRPGDSGSSARPKLRLASSNRTGHA